MVKKKETKKRKPPAKAKDSRKNTKQKGALDTKKSKKPLKRKKDNALGGAVC
jgi:hypothetical protein